MYQMKNTMKLINHNIVSLYTHPSSRQSVAKFGSWDPTGLAVGNELNMIKTIDKTTWALRVNEFEMHAYDMTPSFSESSE